MESGPCRVTPGVSAWPVDISSHGAAQRSGGPGTDTRHMRLGLKAGLAGGCSVRAPRRHRSTAHTPTHGWWSSSQLLGTPVPPGPRAAAQGCPPGTAPHPTFSPLMKRSFSLRFTWSMERPCSARDSKATVPSDLDTTRPFLPVICGRGGGEGTGCQPLWSPRGWSPWASVSLSPHLGPWGSWVCVAGGCQDPASCQARVPTGP